ncbi:hypothetical protein LIER_25564 [Lithospermum erythrorhizon]|uniref:Uncharacterized protein n=1 Tax=Lithospermum erythrorhizon TaxID=34254 RepID=A0AAV3R6R6_LITER
MDADEWRARRRAYYAGMYNGVICPCSYALLILVLIYSCPCPDAFPVLPLILKANKVQINRKSRERFRLNPNRDAINKRRRDADAAKRLASHANNSALDGHHPSCEVPSPNVRGPDVLNLNVESFLNQSMALGFPSKAHSPNLEGSDDDPSTSLKVVQSNKKEINILLNAITSLSINGDEKEKFPSVHIQDLVGMIRNAERNFHLLNNARVRALEDLEKILGEKKALNGEINTLQAKLAETDERIKIAAQEKIHMEVASAQQETVKAKKIEMWYTLNQGKEELDEYEQEMWMNLRVELFGG